MANRAYLYATDLPPDLHTNGAWLREYDLDRNGESFYYDSRHSIPVVWLYFFRPCDAAVFNVGFQWTGDIGDFFEWKCFAEKQTALATFGQNLAQMEKSLSKVFDSDTVEHICFFGQTLLTDVALWHGTHLVMDTSEILQLVEIDSTELQDWLHDVANGNFCLQELANYVNDVSSG